MAVTYELQSITLSNGLEVLVCPQPQLHRAHVALYVRVGSRFERRENNGLSHFLEHMLYRGTDRLRSAHAVNHAFERLGGYLYAATQTDFSAFSLTLPPESIDEASALFGEVLNRPAFLDIELEKGIVCEEILEDLDDEGRQIDADNLSRALIYPDHPLGFTITGDEERVRSFDEAALRAHHALHYTAASSVLVLSGAIDPSRALRLAERDFASLPAGTRIATASPQHDQKRPRLELLENVSSQTDLRVCLRALPEASKEQPALDLMMRIVDDGMSTRLYHRLCDDKGLCYDVTAGYEGYEDDGVVDFAAGVQHKRAARVTREVLAMMTDLALEGPSEEEVAKAKRRHAWDTDALRDSPEDLAAFHAVGTLFGRHETPEERKAKLGAVTAKDVRNVARTLAHPSRLNVVAVGLVDGDEEQRLRALVEGWQGAR
jgi:predicted Zn-dependent peptidase